MGLFWPAGWSEVAVERCDACQEGVPSYVSSDLQKIRSYESKVCKRDIGIGHKYQMKRKRLKLPSQSSARTGCLGAYMAAKHSDTPVE